MRRLALTLAAAAALAGCGIKQEYELPPEPDAPGASSAAGTLIVSVIDAGSQPLAGVQVSLIDAKGAAMGGAKTTDGAGVAKFEKLPAGTGYKLRASGSGMSAEQGGLAVTGQEKEPILASLMLAPAQGPVGTVGGAVTSGTNGLPVEGAVVKVLGTALSAVTRVDGTFAIKDVPVGSPTLVASRAGFVDGRVTAGVKAAALTRADLKLYPAANGARVGRTVITTGAALIEVDPAGLVQWRSNNGGFQARSLANGNFLVTGRSGVFELSPAKTVLWRFQPLAGGLDNPQGVAKSLKTGKVYAADTGRDRVVVISPQAAIERALPVKLVKPAGVDRVDATDTTLVADTGANRVIEVDDLGQIVWALGDGTPGTLNHPTFAARLPNGNTLITDSGNSRVMEVNRKLQLVWMYGGNGDGAELRFPSSATRLPGGTTLIADTGNNRVIEVDARGELVWQTKAEVPLFAERL